MAEKQKWNEKVPIPAMCEAIIKSRGIKAAAGRMLDVHWETVDRYIKRYKSCAEAYEVAASMVTDQARSNVVQAILKGDVAESKWWLTKKTKEFEDRVKQENVGEDGGPITIRVVYDDDANI